MRTPAYMLLAALSSIVMLCSAQAAFAQAVNKCTVGGRIVFQSAPCAIEARPAPAGVVADAAANPANASTAPKKKTLADMLRERDGASPEQPVSREFQQDGANVLRSRMGAV